jgi:hypothetical protein
MASKTEKLDKDIERNKLTKLIKSYSGLLEKATKEGKSNKYVSVLEIKIESIKKKLALLDEKDKKMASMIAEKPKKSNKIAGSMTQAECMQMLEKMKGSYLKSESTEKKNIKSGRAIEDGSLKPSASLENEAETIENKSEAGQTINKKEQKTIAFNIEAIVKNCIEMIKYKKDADQLIKDLIEKLGNIRADIRTGRIKPGVQN